MTEIFFIGDTHFGHRKILDYEPCRRELGATIEEHDEELIRRWNATVGPRDLVWHLGDVAWGRASLASIMGRLNGDKRLIMGNHDCYPSLVYLEVFSKVYGVAVLKTGEVLSHIPLHPSAMRQGWNLNIHGHLHGKDSPEGSYFNVSCERIGFKPISYDDLRARAYV